MWSSSRKGLADRVDAGQRHARRGQRVDALVRRPASVAGATQEAHELGNHAIVGAAHGQVAVFGTRSGVDHHRRIDVVEGAQAHHLGLAAQELEFALLAKRQPLLELDVLLGGHRDQRDAAGQLRRHLAQGQARAEHHRHLGVVAAGVHGARAGIAVGVLPAQQ